MGFSSSSDHQQDKNMIMDEKNSSSQSHDELSSMDSGGEEEVTSSFTSSSTSSLSHSISPPSGHPTPSDPLNNMSSLLQQLPIKRGLSKYYDGKSKSFTCLADVKTVEDLAKPEHPYSKRLRSSKSFLGPSVHDQNASSRVIKKSSRASSSSFNGEKKNANKPPTHPPPRPNSTTHFPNQPSTQTQPQPQNKTHFIF